MYLLAGSFSSTWSVPLRDLKPWLRLIQRLRFANTRVVKLEQGRFHAIIEKDQLVSFQIITGAVDSHLNADKYIVPGLGDYGDRFLFQMSPLIH